MDRPLFDDESLPAWLKNAGITHAGRKRQTGTSAAAPYSAATPAPATASPTDMSWLSQSSGPQTATGDTPPWMQDIGDGGEAAETPSWMQENTSPVGMVEVPGWMQSLDEDQTSFERSSDSWSQAAEAPRASAPSSSDVDLPWMTDSQPESPSQSGSAPAWSGTGALPWRQGVSSPSDEPAAAQEASLPWEAAASEPVNQASDFDLGDSDASFFADSEPQKAPEPEPPAKPRGLADRLRATGTQTQVPASADLDWLKDETPAPPASEPQASGGDDFDWLNAGLGDTEAEAPQPEAAPVDDLNWLNDASLAETPVEPEAEPAATSEDDFGWLNAASEGATPEPTAEAEPASDLNWLDAAPPAEEAQPPEPESTPEPPAEIKSLKSLKSLRKTDEQPVQQPPAEAPRPGIKRLPKSGEQPPAQPAMPPMPAQPAPDLSNMTYDQWDQMQQAKEDQAKEAADPNMVNEVPDWFKNAPAAPTSSVDDADAPDWFKSMSAPSGPPTPAASTEDVPDWFKGSSSASGGDNLDFNALFGASEAAPAQPMPPAPTPPPAMQTPPPPQPPAAPPAPVIPEPAQEEPQFDSAVDFSDMLDFVSEEPHEPEAEPEAESSAEAEDMPDWMRNMAPVASTPMPEPEAQDDMDWLSNIDEQSAPSPAPAETPAMEFDADQDWLASVTPEAAAQAPAPSVDLDLSKPVNIDELLNLTPVTNTGPLPSTGSLEKLDDLDDFNLDAVLGPATEAPAEPSGEFEDFEVSPITEPGSEPQRPSGLRRIGEPAQPEPQKQSENPEQLPDWIADLKPSDAPVPLHIGDQEVRLKEVPVGQLDDQLRHLRERSKAMKNRAVASEAPTTGTLSGIAGAIDVAQNAVTPGASAASSTSAIVTDVQSKRVKLIQQILELEEEMLQERAGEEAPAIDAKAAARARSTVRRPFPKVDRLVITIIMALAIAGPFLSSALGNILPVPDKPRVQAAHDAFVNKINAIQGGQPVLVAFEYGPTAAGELDDLARSILSDLFKRGAHPIIVSTNPAGAMHAESLLATIGNDKNELAALGRTPDQPLQAIKDYIVLRYLPDGAAGVRSVANALLSKDSFQEQIIFGTDITGQPTGTMDYATLQNNPAIVFAESPEDVRNWAEQYNSSLYPVSASQQLSIMLVSSAAASAVAQTYADTALSAAGTSGTPRIIGPLVGLRDAMTYNGKTSDPVMIQRWESVGLAALLAGLVIFAGILINLVRVLQRRAG